MSEPDLVTLRDRARGCLWGLALGDALGMPTQSLSPRTVATRYGGVRDFLPAASDHPLAAGLPAGSVTDDTEQALILADLLRAGGRVDATVLAEALLAWEDSARARGRHDLLGPSTRAALAAWRSGAAPAETGSTGATNGAAMRIAPLGIVVRPGEALVDRVVEASTMTHGTSVGLAAAAAVATAVSSRLEGAGLAEAVDRAISAAETAAERGTWTAGAIVARRIAWASDAARSMAPADLRTFVVELVGTSLAAQESVPAAFAIAVGYADRPWDAMCAAASLGGDADTVAAMVGAIAGAGSGLTGLPGGAVRLVASVNALDMAPVADRLVTLRCS